MYDESNEYTEAELTEALDRLFPQGFAGDDVVREIAPDGWEKSPWYVGERPAPDSLSQEITASMRAMENWKPGDPMPTFPSMDDFKRRVEEMAAAPPPAMLPVAPEVEIRELVARCIWDVFSENHDVTDADGRKLHLGSFRGSAGFLAQYLNTKIGKEEYIYMDFYMGNTMAGKDVDLGPVYRMIFRRLRNAELDWSYSFPRLHLVDFRPLKEQMDRENNPEGEYENYDPSEAFEKEEENRKKDEELAEMREKLDEGYRESVEAALDQPPPATVQAYEAIYGEYPKGWPPEVEE